MNENDSNRAIGLALGGGAVLGAAHVGVLRVLEEEGVKTGWVAGTSIGAIIGALHAFGLSADEIEERITGLSWLNITNFKPSRLGLLSITKLGEFMTEALGDVNLEDAPIPLAVVAADIHSGRKMALTKGNLAVAVSASSCIPGIFSPVDWEDRKLVDGGIVENLPLQTVKDLGADRVLGVELQSAGLYPEPKSIIDIVLNASSILLHTTRMIDKQADDVIITPKLTAYSSVDTSYVHELVAEGYRSAKEAIEDIRNLVRRA